MDRHPVVLELGVEPLPVRRREGQLLERIHVGKEEDDDEERDDREQHARDVGHELAVLAPVGEDRDGREERQQDHPEEQRAALAGPQAGRLVEGVERPVGVAGDVEVLEVVAEEGHDDPGGRHHEKREHGVDAALPAENQVAPAVLATDEGEHHPPDRHRKGDPEGQLAEYRHPASSSGVASYRLPHFVSTIVASKTPSSRNRPSTTVSTISSSLKVSGRSPW